MGDGHVNRWLGHLETEVRPLPEIYQNRGSGGSGTAKAHQQRWGASRPTVLERFRQSRSHLGAYFCLCHVPAGPPAPNGQVTGYLVVLTTIFNFVLGPPLPWGVPGEGPDSLSRTRIEVLGRFRRGSGVV